MFFLQCGTRLFLRAALIAIGLSLSMTAGAQNVVPTATQASLGRVVSAASGTTTFNFAPSSGAVTQAGNGIRLDKGEVRSLVTLSCGSQGSCSTSNVVVRVSRSGSGTGRMGALSNLTVAMGSATLVGSVVGADTLIFTILPVGRNNSKTFYVGATAPIAGNESAAQSGTATSQFQVSAQSANATNTALGTVSANVFRPLSVGSSTPLSFGRIIAPLVGSGTVQLSANDGVRATSGGVAVLSSPAASAARFTVSGEGAQILSINVPSMFALTGPSSITVTTSNTVSAAPTLSGVSGTAGSYSFSVGGSLPVSSSTPSGAYTGTLTVTVTYN